MKKTSRTRAHYVGIDAGSRAIKVAVLAADSAEVCAVGVCDQGLKQAEIAARLLAGVLRKAGIRRSSIRGIAATGYGRAKIVNADHVFTEITCHAHGAHYLFPAARTIIDIGGQDTKVIRLRPDGMVHDFAVNDRCAAGTGRFLEMASLRLDLDLMEFGRLAMRSRKPCAISSTCVVFAETEIIGLLAEGKPPAGIAAGIQNAIADRICAMVGHRLDSPVVCTGGVVMIPGIKEALARKLGVALKVVRNPQHAGAIGAALMAMQNLHLH
jgi:(R)-2-hydroxyacyl-CoA dehydratese activating ATPase